MGIIAATWVETKKYMYEKYRNLKTCKKSICFFSPYIVPVLCKTAKNSGGAERQFAHFGKYLHRRGWKVSYIVDRKDMAMIENDPPWCKLYPVNISYLGASRWHLFPGIVSLYYDDIQISKNLSVNLMVDDDLDFITNIITSGFGGIRIKCREKLPPPCAPDAATHKQQHE